MVIRLHSLFAGAILPLVFSMLTSFAIASPQGQATHILAIGVCPPWKNQAVSICTKGVTEITNTLSERLDIPTDNQHILLNEAATTQGAVAQINTLQQNLGPNDRLIIYANLHAGAADPSQPAGPENDVLVFWSDEEPAAIAFALAEQVWLKAHDFAELVLSIPAGEIVVFLDACESNAASPLFLHSLPGHQTDRPIAVVSSALATQVAQFSADGTEALFTQQLNASLASATGQLFSGVQTAAKATNEAAAQHCAQTSFAPDAPAGSCAQTPSIHDPSHLLSRIQLAPL